MKNNNLRKVIERVALELASCIPIDEFFCFYVMCIFGERYVFLAGGRATVARWQLVGNVAECPFGAPLEPYSRVPWRGTTA